MKRKVSLVVAALLFAISSATPVFAATGKVISCAGIVHVAAAKKDTALPCLDGGAGLSFQSLRGPVVVNVWGSWCGPCIEEIPHFRALAAKNKVRIVGIDVEERNMAGGRKFVLSHGMTWPILFDPDGRTKGIFGLGVPVTWFIDAKGKVIYKQIGTIHSDQALFDLVTKNLGVKL